MKAQLRRHNRAEVHDISVKKVFGIAGMVSFYRHGMKASGQTGGDLVGTFKLPKLASMATQAYLSFESPDQKYYSESDCCRFMNQLGSVHDPGKSDRMMYQSFVDTT